MKGSLPRTLRRLWTAELVELVTSHATRPTLTDQAAEWRAWYATVQASPDAAYPSEGHGSAEAYVEAVRAQAECPRARVRRVALTPKGRAAVTREP